jgi:hypothetical protein
VEYKIDAMVNEHVPEAGSVNATVHRGNQFGNLLYVSVRCPLNAFDDARATLDLVMGEIDKIRREP